MTSWRGPRRNVSSGRRPGNALSISGRSSGQRETGARATIQFTRPCLCRASLHRPGRASVHHGIAEALACPPQFGRYSRHSTAPPLPAVRAARALHRRRRCGDEVALFLHEAGPCHWGGWSRKGTSTAPLQNSGAPHSLEPSQGAEQRRCQGMLLCRLWQIHVLWALRPMLSRSPTTTKWASMSGGYARLQSRRQI